MDADLPCKIFGWKFSGLAIHIQQRQCEFLLDALNSEAVKVFVDFRKTYESEIAMQVEFSHWCSSMCSRY